MPNRQPHPEQSADALSLRSLQVDHLVKLDRHWHRQVTLEDAIDIIGRATMQIGGASWRASSRHLVSSRIGFDREMLDRAFHVPVDLSWIEQPAHERPHVPESLPGRTR